MHVVIARLCLLLLTPLALSLWKATPVLTKTLALSLEGHSLDLSAQMSLLAYVVSLPPATRALGITLNFSPQNVSAAAGRLAACAMVIGASGRRLWHHPL
jgi:hypothetical protein